YFYDFFAHQRKGMPRPDDETFSGKGKVTDIAFIGSRIGGKLFLYGFVFLFGGLLQLIQAFAERTLLFGRNRLKGIKQVADNTLGHQKSQSESFDVFLRLWRKLFYF